MPNLKQKYRTFKVLFLVLIGLKIGADFEGKMKCKTYIACLLNMVLCIKIFIYSHVFTSEYLH
jgi:hypothetical protein